MFSFFFSQSTASDSEATFRESRHARQARPSAKDRYRPRKTPRKTLDDDDSSGISSSDYGDVISGNVRRSDVKMGSRQPKPAVRRYSAGDETSEAVQYSLQQINSDLARILRLLSTRPQAFGYSSVTQGPLAAEPVRHQSGVTQTPFVSEPVRHPSSVTQAPFVPEPVTQPFADSFRGSRVTSAYPESRHGFHTQAPYQPGPEPLYLRSAGGPVLSSHRGQAQNL